MTIWLETLWQILNDPESENIIYWNSIGDGFIIKSIQEFELKVLSKYYKHCRYSSFLRSLCYYNFTRVSGNGDCCEYKHQNFHKDRPQSVSEIQRKPSSSAKSSKAKGGASTTKGASSPVVASVPNSGRSGKRKRGRVYEEGYSYGDGPSGYEIIDSEYVNDPDQLGNHNYHLYHSGSTQPFDDGSYAHPIESPAPSHEEMYQETGYTNSAPRRPRSYSETTHAQFLLMMAGAVEPSSTEAGSSYYGSKSEEQLPPDTPSEHRLSTENLSKQSIDLTYKNEQNSNSVASVLRATSLIMEPTPRPTIPSTHSMGSLLSAPSVGMEMSRATSIGLAQYEVDAEPAPTPYPGMANVKEEALYPPPIAARTISDFVA